MINAFIVFGYISTGLGILQNIPQLALIYRVKHTDELSLTTLLMRLTGAAFASAYIHYVIEESGFELSLPIIISNVSTWITTIILLYFKLYLFKDYEKIKVENPEF